MRGFRGRGADIHIGRTECGDEGNFPRAIPNSWSYSLTTLCLNFLICKLEISSKAVVRIKWVRTRKTKCQAQQLPGEGRGSMDLGRESIARKCMLVLLMLLLNNMVTNVSARWSARSKVTSLQGKWKPNQSQLLTRAVGQDCPGLGCYWRMHTPSTKLHASLLSSQLLLLGPRGVHAFLCIIQYIIMM